MFCFDLDVFIFIDLFIRIDQRKRERKKNNIYKYDEQSIRRIR